VNAALDLDLRAQGKPGRTVQIAFPFLPGAMGKTVSATVKIWRPPPKPGAAGDDIAGLLIEGSLPDDAVLVLQQRPVISGSVGVVRFAGTGLAAASPV
jgi:hypothetical protein